jgi:CheY-like chemotaxis protein
MGVPGRRVLVADQDATMRLRIARDLDELGWDALVVNSGAEAIRVAQLGMPIDVLLIALRLPDSDGETAAWMVSRLRPDVRVCFMASVLPAAAVQPAGAPVLTQPFTRAALTRGLTTAVAYPR